ncbi:hypothetical protein ACP3TD_09850 [Pseudarthrobacter sp. 1G09]|uniref:hypothetical protein n=1 Tax=Pseudarthrobacter sp. 1G09 TaxID=3416178 RepID=UPI003CFA684D
MTSAEPEARLRPTHPQRAVDLFVLELSARHPDIEVLAPTPETGPYRYDAATAKTAVPDAGTDPDLLAATFPCPGWRTRRPGWDGR